MTLFNLEHDQFTHVGMKRGNNQDSIGTLLAGSDQQFSLQGHLFLVADGMGGHLGGEKASEMASKIIPLSYSKLIGHNPAGMKDALEKAFIEANEAIHRKGHENRDFYNMGTTCSSLVVKDSGAWVGHVGDSRVYLVRRSKIHQLTFDHSLVWQAAKERGVEPETVHDVMSNRILRCLGPERQVDIDVHGPHDLLAGDAFVLCSDGLSGFVTDNEMAMAAANLPASLATRFLVNLANLRGGGDNISTVVIKVPGEVDRKKSVRMSEPTLKNRSKIDWDWIWLPLLILLLISPLAALSFFIYSPLQEFSSWKPIAVISTSIIIAGLVILLTGLGKIQLDKYRENSIRKSGSGTVPISRTKDWNIGDQVIEQMVTQSEELMVAGQSILDEGVRVSITDALAKAKISRTAGNLKEAFLAGAAAFTGLAPVIEGMVRFQQIPPCKMIWSRSEQ
ncbi:MAG: protein phosphatase 2C domain-containing protein [Planctomycetota bacterium]|nr:protein phosphatase 2C domain-containing protein [Planctomycetota bacterium]